MLTRKIKADGQLVKLIIYLFVNNLLMAIVWKVNIQIPAAAGWLFKSEELLKLNLPSDNYYPPGSALLLIPFTKLENSALYATFFYMNIGLIFFYLICNEIKSQFLNIIALSTLSINVYLFWLMKGSQDTVYEFAFVMISTFLLIKNYWKLSFMSLFMLSQIRSGYVILFCIVSVLLFFKNKSYNFSRKLILIPLILFIMSASVNLFNYGTTAPSNTSGQTLYFGQNKYFYLASPLYDVDVFLAQDGHMDVPGYKNEDLWSLDFNKIDELFLVQAIKQLKENPASLIQNTISKVDNLFFNFQKVPNLPGKYWLSRDGSTINIDQSQSLTLKHAIGNLLYFLYRVISVLLMVYTLSLLIFFRKKIDTKNMEYIIWSLLPIVSWIPLSLIYYNDTRFRIVPECLIIPAAVYFLNFVNKHDLIQKSHVITPKDIPKGPK